MIRLAQHLAIDDGGRVGVYLPERPAAAPEVTFYNAANAPLGAAHTTTQEDPSTTTISSAVTAGDITLAASVATGLRNGQDLELGPANPESASEPIETVRVQSVSGTVVTLARRLLYDHASGVALRSTLCYYDASSADVGTAVVRNGRAEFAWVDAGSHSQTAIVRLDITPRQFEAFRMRRFPAAKVNEQSLWDRWSTLDMLVPAQCDLRAVLDMAEQQVLSGLDPRFAARQFIGCDLLVDAAAYQALSILWRMSPGSTPVANDPFAEAVAMSLNSIVEIGATDTDDDGAVDTRPRQRHDLSGASGP